MTPLVDRRPEYDELLRLAEAATPGPWKYPVGGAVVRIETRDSIVSGEVSPNDGRWIAAADPAVVAALIRENRQQAERIYRLESAVQMWVDSKDAMHAAAEEVSEEASSRRPEAIAQWKHTTGMVHAAEVELRTVVRESRP